MVEAVADSRTLEGAADTRVFGQAAQHNGSLVEAGSKVREAAQPRPPLLVAGRRIAASEADRGIRVSVGGT